MYEGNAIQAFGQEYSVDLVICIDGTGSMRKMIENVKNAAKTFYSLFLQAMEENDPPKKVKPDGLRVKVIVFRDFADSSSTPLESTDGFFNLQNPAELDAFNRFVDGIENIGGGDLPENALEAIATALKSEWEPRGGRFRRQAILVFTDTLTYDLNNPQRRLADTYPSGMPRDLTELGNIWEVGDQELAPYYSPQNGRLIIFAPPHTGLENDDPEHRTIEWERFSSWSRVWVVPVEANGGCADVDMKQALAVLVGSF